MKDMTNQKRHQTGAPASQGGQFAADIKSEATAELVDVTKEYRDLGVAADLTPFSDRDDPDMPANAVQVATASNRLLVLSITDGELSAHTPNADMGYTTTSGAAATPEGAASLIADTLSASAVHDTMSNLALTAEDDVFELRDTDANILDDGSLSVDVMISDEDGDWHEVVYNHTTGAIGVYNDGEAYSDEAAEAFLAEAGGHLVTDGDWTALFREHAKGIAEDIDTNPEVKAAAAAAVAK
jgi:hypothetical protein